MSFSFGGTTAAAPAASSGFSFGASTPAPAAGAAPAAGGGFSFGGATATPAPASGGFSFGGGATTATPAPAAASGGFSFGGTSTATAAPAASGGFSFGGGATTATPAPAASSGGFSFGGTNTTAAAPAASGGFSFGGKSTTAPAATPASSGGFSFGASAPATSTAGGSLFGGATTTTTPSLFGGASGGSSMFGAKPAGTTSLFGGAAPSTATTSSFGGFNTGFGTTQQQQPQQALPVQPSIKLETKFDALPADVKKNMTDFHKFLKDEDQSDAFLKSVSARKLDALKGNLDQLEQDVLVRRNLQDRQATAVHHVRKDVKHLINQVDTATLNLRSMSGESTSQKFYGIMRRVEMPSPYYWELLDNFEARMEQLKSQIESVESEFKPLYDKQRRGGGASYDAASFGALDPAMLQQILISQNNALIQVAAHVAEVHEKTEEMRQAFIRKMKEDMLKHGDKNLAGFKNPFDKKKKNSASRESDIDNIRFKTSVAPTIVATHPPPQQQAAPTTGFGGFGTTPATGTTGFGATSSFGQTATATSTAGSSLFGGGAASTAAAPTISTGGGFSFGGTTAASTAPKQVSFSLGGSAAPTVSTGAASTGFGFGAPATPAPGASAAASGGFGAAGSSFMAAGTPAFGAVGAGDKRTAGTAGTASKSGGLRSRQKKR